MIVIPAIDIEGGRVAHGAHDPVREALDLRDAGARWLHVVDLDRAFGRGHNDELVRRVAALEGCHVQLGGGLAAAAAVRDALAWGVARVIIALSLALEADGLPSAALGVNLDLRDGRVWPRGTAAPLEDTPAAIVDRITARDIRTVVCRDLDRDGRLTGADLDTAASLVGRGADVFAAGGVARLEELARAREMGLAGVIVGRALHVGRLPLEEALAWSA